VIKKIAIAYIIIITLALIIVCFLWNNSNKNINWSTNVTELTNYTFSNIPFAPYKHVNITNTNEVIVTNFENGQQTLTTNLILIMNQSEYSNLILLVSDDSNFINSLISATYSNGYLILTHWSVTNIIKLPENLIKQKYNIVEIGYTLDNKIYLGYSRKLILNFLDKFDISGGAFILFNSKEIEPGVKLNLEF
jgi:hypothetical protein